MTNTKTPEQLSALIRSIESTASERTLNRLWREYFKAEDARKALHGGWAR